MSRSSAAAEAVVPSDADASDDTDNVELELELEQLDLNTTTPTAVPSAAAMDSIVVLSHEDGDAAVAAAGDLDLASFRHEWQSELAARSASASTNPATSAAVTSDASSASGRTSSNYSHSAGASTSRATNTATSDSLAGPPTHLALPPSLRNLQSDDTFKRAFKLHQSAAYLESTGQALAAMELYREAFQLVPDIDRIIVDAGMVFPENEDMTWYDEDEGGKAQEDVLSDYDAASRSSNTASLHKRKGPAPGDAAAAAAAAATIPTTIVQRNDGDLVFQLKADAHAAGYDLWPILPMRESTLRTTAHISDLPIEILLQILLFVIGSELDLRSLEAISRVCKQLHILARDESLWRHATMPTNLSQIHLDSWEPTPLAGSALSHASVSVHSLMSSQHRWRELEAEHRRLLALYTQRVAQHADGSAVTLLPWRSVYIQRPRVRVDGLYIARLWYVRAGEKSLDNFFQPFHRVEYYRYLRFFADGTVISLITPDDPTLVVPRLKNPPRQTGAEETGYLGKYRLHGDIVVIKVKKMESRRPNRATSSAQANTRGVSSRRPPHVEPVVPSSLESIFYMELQVKSSASRRNSRLTWLRYSSIMHMSDATSTVNDFDLSSMNEFIFSRVRSYV
ncbi:Fbxo9 protein [Capsaspora owczarzaki ATCC 30864]|uniref:Fbxo9 protein n=1 Tax=Capsaspora owczarzaki (strain ATCC 30864) TaxID=595528 RepID=A0A0D2VT33_CAPO3|nr:Fbxo9 protein [Capsaspora owczarzaki ATCC 30864]KJE94372.1 Fbxo9 protein [Capsaspora owczarzaki ATCC 30864]|eukprot:XP_004346704.1 Fbxo9 protein [Capsaspora owczarzaki ATCC 30864]